MRGPGGGSVVVGVGLVVTVGVGLVVLVGGSGLVWKCGSWASRRNPASDRAEVVTW